MSVPRAARAASYEPGAWLALSGEHVWMLAALDPASPVATACHEAVARGAAPSAVLELLVANGVRSLAGFAVVGVDGDDLRLVVVGGAVAEIDTAHGERSRLSGMDAPTWVEQQVSGATRVRLSGGERLGGAFVAMPLAAGMAFASALTITPAGVPAPVGPLPFAPEPVVSAPAGPPNVASAAMPEPPPVAAALETPDVADLNVGTRSSATAPAPPDSAVASTPPAAPPASAETMHPPRGDGLIDSVPWSVPVPTASAPAAAAAPELVARPLVPRAPEPVPPPHLPPIGAQVVAGQAVPEPAADPPRIAPGNPLGWVSAEPPAPSETIYPPPHDPQGATPGARTTVPAAPPTAGPTPAQPPPAPLFEPPPALPIGPPPGAIPVPPPPYAPPHPYDPAPTYAAPAAAPPPEAAPPAPLAQPAAAPGALAPHGPEQSVLAVVCPYGHLSPPYAGACRVCNTPIGPQEPFQTSRPVLGILNLSTGDTVTLDRDVVLGRAPVIPPGEPNRRPHEVRLSSPGNDISRTHLEVRLDGWHVLVTDLGSTNGTIATLPGQPPLRLRAHDALAIVPGTIVSIADEVSFRFEVPA